jgi:hypothetical protein
MLERVIHLGAKLYVEDKERHASGEANALEY